MRFAIGELVERTGVPATTIHHYRTLGLLPPPVRAASNRFFYDERHVQALRLVRLLRERRHLGLETIRAVLPELLAVEEEAFRPEMWDRVLADRDAVGLRAAIVEAAHDAFTAHGYAEVNMADIADGVGVGKGTVYRHFASKEALFAAAARESLQRVVRAFDDRIGAPPVSRETAVAGLAHALVPELALLVEIVHRGLRAANDRDAPAREVLAGLAACAGAAVGDPSAGPAVLRDASAEALRGVLGPPG